jgi:hypothetical protein
MTLPRSVADVLAHHVRFEIESIDRMYLHLYQPRLQYGGGVTGFFVAHRGYKYASSVLMEPITRAFVANVHHFVDTHGLDLVHFAKGQRKERPRPAVPGGPRRQRDGAVRRPRPGEGQRVSYRAAPSPGHRSAVRVAGTCHRDGHQFYFYCFDADFGAFFIKFCSYFPCNAKLCINGHEWAKQQAAQAGIGFDALDNGFAAVDDVAALQAICDTLGPTRSRR